MIVKDILKKVLAVALFGVVLGFGGFLSCGFAGEKTPAKPEKGQQVTAQKKEKSEKDAKKEAKKLAEQKEKEAKARKERIAAALDEKKPHDISLLVRKSSFRLYVLDDGKEVCDYGVALGKNPGQKEKSGDMKTPEGTYRVDEIDDSRSWTHDFGDGKGEIKGAYGPWFISLDTSAQSKGKWGGIGIHGTHDPASIGTRASEGCIRLRNEDLLELIKFVKVGTKVTIES